MLYRRNARVYLQSLRDEFMMVYRNHGFAIMKQRVGTRADGLDVICSETQEAYFINYDEANRWMQEKIALSNH